ncbi:hypothetical protein [Intestinimonas butyriciproducens]|uniref:hypothetical protein n=1 Tax=Intestinimonas butyriciproducens TaxID=1297617 RepID=UPI00195D1A44|nr:hypothetical protein [Intestinimonas butyriciproducens]MBM6919166.1 hypothetical protein [Intestinimonas butyriciproducens]
MKEVLSQNNVRFVYIDVTSSIGYLRQFLKVRDTYPAFEEIRKESRVGLPTLFVDNTPYLVDGPEHALQLIDELQLKVQK